MTTSDMGDVDKIIEAILVDCLTHPGAMSYDGPPLIRRALDEAGYVIVSKTATCSGNVCLTLRFDELGNIHPVGYIEVKTKDGILHIGNGNVGI